MSKKSRTSKLKKMAAGPTLEGNMRQGGSRPHHDIPLGDLSDIMRQGSDRKAGQISCDRTPRLQEIMKQ
jgi:hypothetical protein